MRALVATCFLGALAFVACRRPTSANGPRDSGAGADVAAIAPATTCRATADCSPDEVCEFTPGLCGKGKKPGACREKPGACIEMYAPVCGCDGRAYESECAAHAAGVDISTAGGCKDTIPGWAACGGRYCDVTTSYCEIFLSDVPEPPTDYFCRPLPASCLPVDGASRGCECFPPGTRCGSFCGPLPTAPGAMTGFHLTCQGKRPPSD